MFPLVKSKHFSRIIINASKTIEGFKSKQKEKKPKRRKCRSRMFWKSVEWKAGGLPEQ